MKDCPLGDSFHYHHDGCPSCYQLECEMRSVTLVETPECNLQLFFVSAKDRGFVDDVCFYRFVCHTPNADIHTEIETSLARAAVSLGEFFGVALERAKALGFA